MVNIFTLRLQKRVINLVRIQIDIKIRYNKNTQQNHKEQITTTKHSKKEN